MKKPGAGRAEPLGAFLSDIVKPTLAARGIGQASLVALWPEIVGAQIARFAEPEQLQWPPRGDKRDPLAPSAPATLVLRIDPAFALEAGHLGPTIVARVNAHLGWRCVDRVVYRQGPLSPGRAKPKAPPPPSPQSLARARALAAGVADDGLREALARLGARILDKGESKG